MIEIFVSDTSPSVGVVWNVQGKTIYISWSFYIEP